MGASRGRREEGMGKREGIRISVRDRVLYVRRRVTEEVVNMTRQSIMKGQCMAERDTRIHKKSTPSVVALGSRWQLAPGSPSLWALLASVPVKGWEWQLALG